MKLYCLKCKKYTKSENITKVCVYIRGNKRLQLKARCFVCNVRKCRFLPNVLQRD